MNTTRQVNEVTGVELKHIISDKIQVSGDLNISVYKRRAKLPDFIMIFQGAIGKMIIEDNLSPMSGKVLWYLCSIGAFGNTVAVRKEVIAEKTHICRTTVWKCIKDLLVRDIINVTKDLNDARIDTYFINGELAWKGKPEKRAIRIKEKNRLHQLSLFPSTDFDTNSKEL